MKKLLLWIILGLSFQSLQAQSLFENYRRNNTNNLGLYALAGLNFGNFFYKSTQHPNANRGLTSPVLEFGFHIHKDLSSKSFLRYGLGIGFSGFGVKYSPKYASNSDSAYALLNEEKEKLSYFLPLVKPHIAYGRFFPIGRRHLLETSIGFSIPIMLTKRVETGDAVSSKVNFRKARVTEDFYSYTDLAYGGTKRFFMGDVLLYIGYRNIGRLDDGMWNRISMGLQLGYSVLNDKSGRMSINYIRGYSEFYAQESYRFGHAYAAVKMSYDLF